MSQRHRFLSIVLLNVVISLCQGYGCSSVSEIVCLDKNLCTAMTARYQELLQNHTSLKAEYKLLQTGNEPPENPSQCCKLPRNCDDIRLQRNTFFSGVYKIYPENTNFTVRGIEVFCDIGANEGWIVIQKREPAPSPPVDFERTWSEYDSGFGNASGSYWLGLSAIAALTRQGDMQLRIDMTDWNDEERYAHYDYFKIVGDNYTLHVDDYFGNAGDSFSVHRGMMFSTKDRDNDIYGGNCAVQFNGAWWYGGCHASNLNGLNLGGDHESYANGINWQTWRGHHHSLKRVAMKVRSRHSRRTCK